MLKIRISYDRPQDQDAERALDALSAVIGGARVRRSDKGKYGKIYIEAGGEGGKFESGRSETTKPLKARE